MDSLFPKVVVMYLSHFRPIFNAPGYRQFQGFIVAQFILSGRKTVTSIAELCFFVDNSLSSWHKFLSHSQWNLTWGVESLIKLVVKELGERLVETGSYLIAVDTTYVTKPLGRMAGVQRWSEKNSSGTKKTQWIGHHWAICGFLARFGTQFRCFPLLSRLLSGKHNPFEFAVCGNGETQPIGIFDSIVSMVYQVAQSLAGFRLQIVADAYFSKAAFINPLTEASIGVVSRLRRDAVGFDDAVYCGRGRRPKRGKKWKLATLVDAFDHQSAKVLLYGKKQTVYYVSRVLSLRSVSQKVKVVAVVTGGVPILLMSSDTTQSARQIIEIYAARFSLETAIRNLKQSVGFGDYQLTNLLSIRRFSWLCCCALTIGQLILAKRSRHAWLSRNFDSTREIQSTSQTWLRRCLLRFVIRRILFSKSASLADSSKRETCLGEVLKLAA